ncbi:MAG TPA: hypothetical protein VMT94_07680 [Burkholderiales bacterium]|nr:hypothetical protein [Burkholderiales bacterium]
MGIAPVLALAQAGPPLLTDDPGTPGDRNWEINVAATADHRPGAGTYETPLLDINYGVGEHIQLKYEVPYLFENSEDGARHGLGNSLFGVKWRFHDDVQSGFSLSTYPQLELNNPTNSFRRGLVDEGPRLLLPVEINREFGSVNLGMEAGRRFSRYANEETILGVAATRQFTPALELLAEIYNAWDQGEGRASTLDLGGRYALRPGTLLLFMLGHSIASLSDTLQPQWIGYLGIQFQVEGR